MVHNGYNLLMLLDLYFFFIVLVGGVGRQGITDFSTVFGAASIIAGAPLDDGELSMGDDDLDHEILYGTLRGDIVGIRYYRGTVSIVWS